MESTPAQTAEGLALCQVLAHVLERLVQANGPMARTDPGQVTRFHAMKAPGIAVQQYLERIHKYASCSNECFVLALIYIDRLIQRSNFLLTELNVHRVVITAVLLAAKFFDDAYYNNAYYAKVGGVLVSEMNGLEVDFLFRINFSLHVAPDVFSKYRSELMVHSSLVNNTMMAMPPILETLATQVYSPQTVPMQSDIRIQGGGACQLQQHQVTPSPPTPPDYAIVNPYDVFHHHHHVATQQQQQQQGFHSIEQQHPPQQAPFAVDHHPQQHHPLHLHVVTNEPRVTPSYFPQHFCDNPYYVPPNAVVVAQLYDATSQDCSVASSSGGGGWNYAMLGVSGAGM